MSARSTPQESFVADKTEASSRVGDLNSALKTFLLECEIEKGRSLFAHLTGCIKRILEERPSDSLDWFEDISRKVRENRPSADTAFLDNSVSVGLAEIQKELYAKGEGEDEETVPEDDVETPLPNMALTSFFFEQAAVGFNREELSRIWMAMKTLVNTQPVDKARFWGKIFGLYQNYYVAEVEYREGEELEEEEEEAEPAEEERDESRQDDEEEVEDQPPKSTWKAAPPIPKEEFRTGTNKKVYFVCNEPGKPWIRLPHVLPAQIQIARKIKKIFTGRLDAEVSSYPPFPGLEINLLRAQIARISAGTQLSPIGFYTFDNEEEEAEEDAVQDNYVENPDYAPLRVKELVDPSLSNWVHHTKHILPQGRCVWFNPVEKKEDEFEEAEEVEEEIVEPERGPALLTPISQDVSIDGLMPWCVRVSSLRIPEYAVAVVSSNLWPGAHAFSFGKHFENIYIGWGYKATQTNFVPFTIDVPMPEYPVGKDILEALDPTPEDEAALKAKQAADNPEEAEEEEEEEN